MLHVAHGSNRSPDRRILFLKVLRVFCKKKKKKFNIFTIIISRTWNMFGGILNNSMIFNYMTSIFSSLLKKSLNFFFFTHLSRILRIFFTQVSARAVRYR